MMHTSYGVVAEERGMDEHFMIDEFVNL